jgi:hypothetical protein
MQDWDGTRGEKFAIALSRAPILETVDKLVGARRADKTPTFSGWMLACGRSGVTLLATCVVEK